ncbi:MAG: PAS domain S-box protein, partial [Chloroflexi bacterium]|nr:PAS domain S-box protein [Chloroflexota bacterium]
PPLLHQTIPLTGNLPWQYLFSHDTPLVITKGQSDPRLTSVYDLLSQHGIVSALIVPLVINGEVIGKLCLGAIEPRSFSPEEINLAWSVADQVAGALARARLTQTYQRLTTVVEQSAESVLITDTEGTILYVNPAFEHTSGYSRAEVVGQNSGILRSEKQDAAFYKEMWATISAGQVWRRRFISQRKDGTLYTEDASISPIRDESRAIVNYVEVRRDVTRELQLEAQYHQSQKMEAIGQLAGGIAHDFNNLVTVINGYSELVLHRYLGQSDPSRKFLEEIKKAGERAASLTGQLLAFSRKQVLQPKILDLNRVVVEVNKMLQRLIGENIEVTTLLVPGLAPIKADPNQLEQVLINLAVNARDAMPSGGKLTIETANVTLDLAYARQHAEVTPGEYVMLTVSDTGVGMTEAIKARIFEPFFTTKEQGKGTGLGLATCFGIVKQSGGSIEVYSELGRGTTFKVYLPCIEEAISCSTKPVEADKLPYGTETILLVEDGVSVRTLAANVLREQGYTVLEAANGEEALYLIQGQPETELHLVLTDVVMPQMGGRELADQLKTVRPDIKVLFTSGYPDDAIVHHGVLEPGIAFLEKPFTLAALARKVREVLDI